MFGTAGLPHILMRFFTVKDAKEARKSVVVATGFIGYFYLLTLLLVSVRSFRIKQPATLLMLRKWQ